MIKWRRPVVAEFSNRNILLWLFLFAIIAKQLNFSIWYCPIKAATGVRCPGCGMITAIMLMLSGNWIQALKTHPFVYPFLFAFVVLWIISLLPQDLYKKSILRIEKIERASGITVLTLFFFFLFGVVRALLDIIR